MADTSLKKFLVPALLTTGALFTALTAPVVIFGSEKLQIDQGGTSVFSGTVRDAAGPYLGLAALTSLGLGASGIALQGWRKTAKKVTQLDKQVDNLQERLKDRETYLQAALTSDHYLERAGLNFFLEDELAFVNDASVSLPVAFEPQMFQAKSMDAQPVTSQLAQTIESEIAQLQAQMSASTSSRSKTAPIAAQPALPEREYSFEEAVRSTDYRTSYQVSSAAITAKGFSLPEIAPAAAPAVNVQTVVGPLTAAQGFLSFARSTNVETGSHQNLSNPGDELTIAKIQALQTQLQQIVTQIEALQVRLVPEEPASRIPESKISEPKIQIVEDLDNGLMTHLVMRPSPHETAWMARRAAS